MARNLVLCFDGTSNQYKANNTNVVRLCQMLEKHVPDQLVYYQPGIGTITPVGIYNRFKKLAAKVVDLITANLLDDHVKGGYRFLMQNYSAGDRVFLFGFSRGAYTARVLAGMLHKVGLLPLGNDEMVDFAWDMYANSPVGPLSQGFQTTFSRQVPIHFLGLWDTVSSVSWAWSPKIYAYTRDNPSVSTVRHALALDERRQRFVQNAWTNSPPAAQSVKEVWFPGVHGDVGGGYAPGTPDLSKASLEWMVKELSTAGILFDATQVQAILPSPPPVPRYGMGDKHESLAWYWWPVEFVFLPHRVASQNYQTRWSMHLGRPRDLPSGSLISQSVFNRPNYHPKNVPPIHTKVP